MIEEYHFGSITINGKIYEHDVELRWTGEAVSWEREESHKIDIETVKRATEQNPDIIVIGTGESGAAKVLEEAQEFISEKGIQLIIDKTEEATKIFNIICGQPMNHGEEKKKVIGLFHLTC